VIYIDTSAFLGAYNPRDQWHFKAAAQFEELARANEPLVTSNFVLDELLTYLGRKMGYAYAARRGKALLGTSAVEFLRPTPEQELLALHQFEKWADQRVSYTDCVSFVLMRAHKLYRVFTFDQHFRLAGFTVIPEIVRRRDVIHEPPADEYDPDPQSP
jgi:predicted nucleic acid-binding protein